MTSIEKYEADTPALAPLVTTAPLSPLEKMREQAESMSVAFQLADGICRTSICPQTFRGKPEDGAVAIMAGATWGLDAIASLQNIFVVHGTPSTYAKVMKAVTLRAGHKVETVESSDTRVVVRAQRAGSDTWEESVWTIERAQKAGYLSNQKYKTEPEAMLYARATAEACRRIAPDAILGMPYSREEMEDVAAPRYVQTTVGAPGVAGLAAALGAAPVAEELAPTPPAEQSAPAQPEPEPVAEETAPEPAPAEEQPAAPKKATARQIAAVKARLESEGYEPKDWSDMLTAWTERDIKTINDLTDQDVAAIDAIFNEGK
ncbi:hypothetical protein [Tsukamurella pseudospumae]|uniref:RecT family protein n=1 Tax=Tsukamurella pseudospumae TaxID=239498 RepID=A0A137ZRN2_9ACTN|nr:hypothetical protein [Tsukamurella pseudospumae]KXP00862.1 hypothetical protein AXK61_12700 [Tsukamurella pseudospumae]